MCFSSVFVLLFVLFLCISAVGAAKLLREDDEDEDEDEEK